MNVVENYEAFWCLKCNKKLLIFSSNSLIYSSCFSTLPSLVSVPQLLLIFSLHLLSSPLYSPCRPVERKPVDASRFAPLPVINFLAHSELVCVPLQSQEKGVCVIDQICETNTQIWAWVQWCVCVCWVVSHAACSPSSSWIIYMGSVTTEEVCICSKLWTKYPDLLLLPALSFIHLHHTNHKN